MICEKRRPLRDMNHIPALGYTCKERYKKTCKLKESLVVSAQKILDDPKLMHLYMSEEYLKLYKDISDFREWLKQNHHTIDNKYTDISMIIKELDRRFPYSISYLEKGLNKIKEVKNHGRI